MNRRQKSDDEAPVTAGVKARSSQRHGHDRVRRGCRRRPNAGGFQPPRGRTPAMERVRGGRLGLILQSFCVPLPRDKQGENRATIRMREAPGVG
jgi:hypothetical protein